MLQVQVFEFNPFMVNTYVVWNNNTKETIIIDAGCFDDNEEKLLDDFIKSKNLNVSAILNTHCHLDHLFGASYVAEKYNSKFLVPQKDVQLADKFQEQSMAFGFSPKPLPEITILDEESSQIFCDNECHLLYTPGHTFGEVCFYFPEQKICFTGDVLFNGSIGRTDLWGGDYDTLINSIKNKLLTLPEETIIYPGHGESSTIKKELATNYYLQNLNKF